MATNDDVTVVPYVAMTPAEHDAAGRQYLYFDGSDDPIQILGGDASFGARVRYLVKVLIGSYGKAAEYLNSGVPGANYTEAYVHKIASRPNRPTQRTIWKLAAGFRIDPGFFTSTDETEMAGYVFRARAAVVEFYYSTARERYEARQAVSLTDMTNGELWNRITVLRKEEEEVLSELRRRAEC